jgi:WD40 repeat protein
LTIGGETTRVECFEDFELDKPFPIMVFGNAVNKILISSDYSYVAACTNETGIFVYSTNYNKTYKPKPGHESSVLHIGFNSTSKYVASTGCDANINIYSISMMEDNPITCRVKSNKLGRETRLESEQIYQFDW